MVLSVFHPITCSPDVHHRTMVEDPIEESCRDDLILEDLSPVSERLIRGKDGRSTLISARNQLEEAVCSWCIKWQVTDLVDDQESGSVQSLKVTVQMPGMIGFLELFDQD